MSGPPHGFPSSFANAQQAAMRNQFVGGPGGQMPGLMAPAQQPGEFCPLQNTVKCFAHVALSLQHRLLSLNTL